MATTTEEVEVVRRRGQIRRYLERLLDARGKLWLAPADGRDGQTVALLGLDDQRDALITDAPAGRAADAIRDAATLRASTRIDGVRSWFEVERWLRFTEHGEHYYAIPFPRQFYRLQRREAFRLPLPDDSGAVCRILLAGHVWQARIRDIAVGGLGITLQGPVASELEPGMVLEGVSVDTGHGVLTAAQSLEVRHIRPTEDGNCMRVGCRFLDPDPALEQQLQQLIHRLQLERIQRGES